MTVINDTTKGSPDRFGYAWSVYKDMSPIYEEQFKRWTPFLNSEDWKGKSFLDVGCGMGRNSYWPLEYGASQGLAIDADDQSLASAQETLRRFPQAVVQRTSIYDLTHQNEFDIAFSIGVIHHLEFPEKALEKMVQATKKGGKVLIWVYGYENNEWIVNIFNPTRKFLFSKLPIKVTHFLSLFPTAMLYAYLKMGFGKIEYMNLIRNYNFSHLRSIVFDQMLPHIAHYWTKDEVIKLLEQANLVDIQIEAVNDMSWCAIGTKKN